MSTLPDPNEALAECVMAGSSFKFSSLDDESKCSSDDQCKRCRAFLEACTDRDPSDTRYAEQNWASRIQGEIRSRCSGGTVPEDSSSDLCRCFVDDSTQIDLQRAGVPFENQPRVGTVCNSLRCLGASNSSLTRRLHERANASPECEKAECAKGLERLTIEGSLEAGFAYMDACESNPADLYCADHDEECRRCVLDAAELLRGTLDQAQDSFPHYSNELERRVQSQCPNVVEFENLHGSDDDRLSQGVSSGLLLGFIILAVLFLALLIWMAAGWSQCNNNSS